MKKILSVLISVLIISLSFTGVFADEPDEKGIELTYEAPAKVTFTYNKTSNLITYCKLGDKLTEQSHEDIDGFYFNGWYYNNGTSDIKWDFNNSLTSAVLEDGLNLMLFQKYTLTADKILNGTVPSNNDLNGSLEMNVSDIPVTDEELGKLAGGKSMTVVLRTSDITSTIEKEAKDKIDKKADENHAKAVIYLDVTLTKQVQGEAEINITKTSNKVKVTIVVPEDLYKANREYTVIRLHEGNTDVVYTGKAGSDRKITFETDEFSIYALAYKDHFPGYDIVNTGLAGAIENTGMNLGYLIECLMIGITSVLSFDPLTGKGKEIKKKRRKSSKK